MPSTNQSTPPRSGQKRLRGQRVRRDASGHMKPAYAAGLLARMKETRPWALGNGPVTPLRGSKEDPLAQMMGEEFVRTATSGEDGSLDTRDAESPDETAELHGPEPSDGVTAVPR